MVKMCEGSDFWELVKAAREEAINKNGSTASMDELWVLGRRLVQKWIRGRGVTDTDDGEDIEQNVFVLVWTHFGQLKSVEKYCGWLKTITEREALNFIRKRNNQPIVEHTFTDPETGETDDTLSRLPGTDQEPETDTVTKEAMDEAVRILKDTLPKIEGRIEKVGKCAEVEANKDKQQTALIRTTLEYTRFSIIEDLMKEEYKLPSDSKLISSILDSLPEAKLAPPFPADLDKTRKSLRSYISDTFKKEFRQSFGTKELLDIYAGDIEGTKDILERSMGCIIGSLKTALEKHPGWMALAERAANNLKSDRENSQNNG